MFFVCRDKALSMQNMPCEVYFQKKRYAVIVADVFQALLGLLNLEQLLGSWENVEIVSIHGGQLCGLSHRMPAIHLEWCWANMWMYKRNQNIGSCSSIFDWERLHHFTLYLFITIVYYITFLLRSNYLFLTISYHSVFFLDWPLKRHGEESALLAQLQLALPSILKSV